LDRIPSEEKLLDLFSPFNQIYCVNPWFNNWRRLWGIQKTLNAYHSSKYSMYAQEAKTNRSVYFWGDLPSKSNEPGDE